ncbi:MAG: type I-A CRISPR-associated protein Cas4/Csa1 [Candidatus Aenigmarchaeota archaeon]|nr:type I-A CRISPR-associated protein Cas4/Csa1 [Candidatus Aenigmarchaeota archaeon]
MYFVFGEPVEEFFGGVLKESSDMHVDESLRGWAHTEPMRPKTSAQLPIYIVAGKYCVTGRDVWLKYVKKFVAEKSKALLTGSLYHEVLAQVVPAAKRYIYQNGVTADFDLRGFLQETCMTTTDQLVEKKKFDVIDTLGPTDLLEMKANMRKLWNFQMGQICAAVDLVLSKHYEIDADSLVAKALPLSVEQRIDGSRIGLSSQLYVDAMNVPHTVIMDTKTGRQHEFHRLTITGYALAYESEYHKPVNLGIILYPKFVKHKSVPYVIKKPFMINDELRREFLAERDRKAAIIQTKEDPGIVDEVYKDDLEIRCPVSCGFFKVCHPEREAV